MDKSKVKMKDQTTKLEIIKHYPWLKQFDGDSRSIANPEMEITTKHVLRLMQFLESKISPEVSILKTKPNRATKFLAQIRKRIAVTKVTGLLTDSDIELLPTFGLLLMHYVNITLVSSKIRKLGVQQVAADLYYMLKLILEVDNEYVLDVVLCSNLPEHASSEQEVGFHMFSYILDDWRYYFKEASSQMKYCYIASLLSESAEGNRLIERNLPSETNKEFVEYLNETLGMKLKVTKNHLLSNIVQQIKTKRLIIKMSRSRLVIISQRTLSKRTISEVDEDSDAESESSSSTFVNIASSSTRGRENLADSSQSDVLGFHLDTAGSFNDEREEWRTDEHDSIVSSSTNKRRRRESESSTDTLSIDRIKTKLSAINEDEDSCSSISELNDEEIKEVQLQAVRTSFRRKSPFSDEAVEIPSRSQSMDVEVGSAFPLSPERIKDESADATSELQERELIGKELREEFDAEIDSDPDTCHDDDAEDNSDSEEDERNVYEKAVDEDNIGRAKQRRSKKLNSVDYEDANEEKDSDLEVVSETLREVSESDDDSSDNERDEAEAESREDIVPNYDEDSDADGMCIDEDGPNKSSESVVVPRVSTTTNNLTLTAESKVADEDSDQDEEEPKFTKPIVQKKDEGKLENGDEEDCRKKSRTKVEAKNKNRNVIKTVAANAGSQDSNSTVVIPRMNGTSSSARNCASPDIVEHSPIRSSARLAYQSQSTDEDDDVQSVTTSTRSSSMSPQKKANLNEVSDTDESQSQPAIQATPSPRAQSKPTRGKKRRGVGTTTPVVIVPITPVASTRRVTRACTAAVTENSETISDSKGLRSRAATKRGRGTARASTQRK